MDASVTSDTTAIEQKPTVRILREQFKDAVREVRDDHGDLSIEIDPAAILPVARLLKTHPELAYDYAMDLASVDYGKQQKPRFGLVYNFYSTATRRRVRIKVRLPEDRPEVDSLTPLWKGVVWFEREAYDMMGIGFRGHPGLTRILTHAEFIGHPLRKDYDSGRRHPLSRSYDLFDAADVAAASPSPEPE